MHYNAKSFFLKNKQKLELLSYLFTICICIVLPISTFLTNVFFIAAILLFFSAGSIKKKVAFIFQNKVAVSFLIFCSMFLIGVFYNTGPFIDGLKILYKYTDKFFYGALLFPIFGNSEKLRKRTIDIFITTMILVLAFSYLKYFGFLPFHFSDHLDEVFKSHIETNFLMAFTSYLIILRIFSHDICTVCRQKQKCGNVLWRSIQILILLSFIVYIFLDAGRSGYFIFGALLLLFLWQKFSWRGPLFGMVAVTGFLIFAINFSSTFQKRVYEIKNDIVTYYPGTVTSVGARLDFAKNSINLIKKHPYFGTGTGSFAYEYKKDNPKTFSTENPHNEFLYIWVQFGILGEILLLWIFYCQLTMSRKLPSGWKELSQGLVVAFFLGCLANSWFRDTTQGHFYVYFSALVFSASKDGKWFIKKRMQLPNEQLN